MHDSSLRSNARFDRVNCLSIGISGYVDLCSTLYIPDSFLSTGLDL